MQLQLALPVPEVVLLSEMDCADVGVQLMPEGSEMVPCRSETSCACTYIVMVKLAPWFTDEGTSTLVMLNSDALARPIANRNIAAIILLYANSITSSCHF